MIPKGSAIFLSVCLFGSAGWALGPHEILLLVNGRSPDSVEIAKEYASLRGVPKRNILRLSLPGNGVRPKVGTSPEEFTKFIWSPATRYVQEQGMEKQILAWVYSVDFPVRIETSPPMSIQGATFLRNVIPAPEVIKNALYTSPLYAGPGEHGDQVHFPQSLDLYREWLPHMPLPSMLLGYTGERGNTLDEVKLCLRRGKISDGSAPTGTVFFVTSDDVRSTCRAWQFRNAMTELAVLGVTAVITDSFPTGKPSIMGLMMGAAVVEPHKSRGYLPGCMAEHLTSAGAAFDAAHQTKLSAWIRSEVTASAGAVTEPYSAWEKFPNARFYVHYAAGSTILESFFLSIKCPLQILLVGDPLAQPWAPKAQVKVLDAKPGPTGAFSVKVAILSEPGDHYGQFEFLLDGRPMGTAVETKKPMRSGREWVREFEIRGKPLAGGKHEVRAIAYRTGLVRPQAFGEYKFTVK